MLENVAAVDAARFVDRARPERGVRARSRAAHASCSSFVGLGEYVDARASDLSYGQRKLVELAQVLMLDPAVILLDEPAAGINPTLVERLAELCARSTRRARRS